MVIHYGYEDIVIVTPVVTLGIFDGVHRGHKVLIDCLINRAKETGGESVVITFSPHPRLILEKDHYNLTFLTTFIEKRDLLAKAGIDHLVVLDFSKQFSRMPACVFIKDILAGRIGAKYLIVGYDHHFGRDGEGDFETIKQCSGLHDFRLEKVEGLRSEDRAISSTSIRDALLNGRLDEANSMLGYNYSLTGEIVGGKKIGRSIGFPTANIRTEPHKLIPSNGVYAVEVISEYGNYPGMLSIGTNPTINRENEIRSIEVNILNFDREIYGNSITVIFRKRLRDEIQFDNTDQLAQQMMQDREDTLKLLSE
jgi:riboflavin kinase/FMN adenylyltransferase